MLPNNGRGCASTSDAAACVPPTRRAFGKWPAGAMRRPLGDKGSISVRSGRRHRKLAVATGMAGKAAAAAATSQVGSQQAVSAVIPWLLANGARPKQCKLDVRDLGLSRGRGLVATETIAAEEVLLSVPFTHVFLEERQADAAHWSSGMAMRLLRILADDSCKHSDGHLRDWALSLPARIDTPPIQYHEDELAACLDIDTLEEATSMRELHMDCSSRLEGEIQSFGLSVDDYSWAVSVLHSRCFCIQPDNLHVAVPGIDMANHSFSPNAGVRVQHSPGNCQGRSAVEDVCEPPEPEPSRFELVAGEDGIRAGEEVTISYGAWPNDLFYLLFGFVPEQNPNDSVVLFSTAADAAEFLNHVASASGAPCWEDEELLEQSRVLAEELPEFTRVVVTTQGFDARLFEGLQHIAAAHPSRNMDPMYVVAVRCHALLDILSVDSHYGQTLAGRETANMRTSELYRQGKKGVLENALTAMGIDH